MTDTIMKDILGMRELYYSNIISFDEFQKFVGEINKKYKLRFECVYIEKSNEPFTNIQWRGYLKTQCVYSFYINQRGNECLLFKGEKYGIK